MIKLKKSKIYMMNTMKFKDLKMYFIEKKMI